MFQLITKSFSRLISYCTRVHYGLKNDLVSYWNIVNSTHRIILGFFT